MSTLRHHGEPVDVPQILPCSASTAGKSRRFQAVSCCAVKHCKERRTELNRRSLALTFGSAALLLLAALSSPAQQIFLKQTNLVTDDPTVNPAVIMDPALVNAWGVSFSPTSPF